MSTLISQDTMTPDSVIGRFRLTSTESLGRRLLRRLLSAHGWYIFTPRLLESFRHRP